LDTSSPTFFDDSLLADRANWDCMLGHMNECQKARVRGFLRSGDFGSVDGPFGFGISDFCACGPPERIPALFNFGCQYLESLGFSAPGGCPGAAPAPVGSLINFGAFTFVAATIPGPCNAPFAPAGAGAPIRAAASPGAPGVCAKVR